MGRSGYRLTEPRRVVAELVAARSGHFTANDLIADAQAKNLGIGRATIFRALDLFTELEVLERLDLPSGEHAYVPCLPQHHHHHIVCQVCGRVTEVEELGLGAAIEEIQGRTGWQVESHRVELYGRCPECQRRMAMERWNDRYAGRDYLWDVGPNQFVERHLGGLRPGTAIDLAAGEGRNAVWLAEQGWRVTAVDFSQLGLDKADRLATDRGVADRVETVNADALTFKPPGLVDLVVIAYLQIPAARQRTALEHAMTWLRPGGTLFVVAHDRSNIERGCGGPSDPGLCYELDASQDAMAGAVFTVAEVARRETETEDGPCIALDTLVIANRSRD
jgi:Fe2+ or Zn2+ uptake regulation protein/predicted O-methyltransferase YrrM